MQLIGYKEGTSKLLVEMDAICFFHKLKNLNSRAKGALELFPKEADNKQGWLHWRRSSTPTYEPGEAWQSIVIASERAERQEILTRAFLSLKVRFMKGHGMSKCLEIL